MTNPQAANSYSYAEDNPIIKKDPEGRLTVNVGGGFTYYAPGSPTSIGPMGGIVFSPDGIYTYQGVSLSARPGPSLSVSVGPGSASPGYGSSVSAYGAYGIFGGSAGMQQGPGGKDQFSVEGGVGLPGVSWDTYKTKYLMSYSQLANNLGGPFSYITTPQTNGVSTNFAGGGTAPSFNGMPNFKGTYDFGSNGKYDYGKGQWVSGPSSGSGSGTKSQTLIK